MNDARIPIVMVEDHEPFARALEAYFALPGSTIDCRAIYSNAEQALDEIPKHPPAIALVDINLPGRSGIECIARLRQSCPQLVCLVLTMYEEQQLIFDALRAGACGYLLKRSPAAEIAQAVEVASMGGSPMTPQIARQVVGFFHRKATPEPAQALTEREREVLDRLIEGKLYKEIAQDLGVSLDTVRTHVRKVYDKLHIHSRTEIILRYGRPKR